MVPSFRNVGLAARYFCMGGLLFLLTHQSDAAPARPIPTKLENGDFHLTLDGTHPSAWSVSANQAGAYDATVEQKDDGRVLRLGNVSPTAGGAALSQELDAAAYRGKLVRLTAVVRVARPAAKAGLFLRVDRPQPFSNGFFDNMEDDPIQGDDWHSVNIVGNVDVDARRLALGLWMSGPGELNVREVSLEPYIPSGPRASPAALAYLTHAISLLQEAHFRTSEIDWKAVSARALAQIRGAVTPSQTYSAIRGVLGTLGDRHSAFLPPPHDAGIGHADGSQHEDPSGLPSYSLIDGRIGYLRVPALNTFGAGGAARGRRFHASALAGLKRLDAFPLCGWIVDLRDNTGGSMWPMLGSVQPLLGPPPWGYFVAPGDRPAPWLPSDRRIRADRQAPLTLQHGGSPVAVLINGRTASAGEAVAIAFAGRREARRFGESSAGYTTANETRVMSDGALLIIASALEEDRHGNRFDGPVEPDVRTTSELSLPAARRWLESGCGPAR
jgi:carboxyl-terminal processing protease